MTQKDELRLTAADAAPKATRAALYVRASTRDGNQDTNNQLQLRQLCTSQGWQIITEYEDHESGSRSDRTQFRQMLQDASLLASFLVHQKTVPAGETESRSRTAPLSPRKPPTGLAHGPSPRG